MKFLSFKPGHDGAISLLQNGILEFCYEGEKDSFKRYENITPSSFLKGMSQLTSIPDVLVISGWVKGFHSIEPSVEAGYYGSDIKGIVSRKSKFLGHNVLLFSSTHERSHIMGAYGMSPWPQGQPCYALVWEGNIGAFYEINDKVHITKLGDVLEDPGNKYAFLFSLANPHAPLHKGYLDFSNAGKLMALVGYAKDMRLTLDEQDLINEILSKKSILLTTDKRDFADSQFYNIGVENQKFKDLTAKFSDAIFEKFYSFAKANLKKNLPLLISGGCGLNCDWNNKWRELNIFSDLFIPPCPNDSGSSIGSAVDAQFFYTGDAKIEWNVYSGEPFLMDIQNPEGFQKKELNYIEVAKFIANNKIIVWVQGKYEIGPRALGNRSILCEPFNECMRTRLNEIKEREQYRPIAPICLESDVNLYFHWNGSSPYMIYFSKVKDLRLKAITHVNKTARIQTVTPLENSRISLLLEEFKKISGVSVLCNTSLNFKGRGFINSMSDLVKFVTEKRIDGFVVGDSFYLPE